jgi:hypothetical protein
MRNHYFDFARRMLHEIRGAAKDPQMRSDIDKTVWAIKKGEELDNERIQEAKMIGIRNPAFDGDFVGYPEDDFDKPGLNGKKTDDDEEKKP